MRVLSAFKVYAKESYQDEVSDVFEFKKPTQSPIVSRASRALNERLSNFVVFRRVD